MYQLTNTLTSQELAEISGGYSRGQCYKAMASGAAWGALRGGMSGTFAGGPVGTIGGAIAGAHLGAIGGTAACVGGYLFG
ncbi:Blp family class II bacteriocin [Fructobacillus durionis]|uniref:Bacteriocin class II with double-glycine leader peptide n=1 Tax=Fructobacillus durionis TaxID=283737 RepID=A0A1I1FLD5_9LACO|nr:Blp family class II bacteriocin [Fructobacillus durionis]SFB99822.1 Bacteriocin class II with double-glycine leader peptide [Fructobacillus durionis]